MSVRINVSKRLQMRLLAGACAALCTVPALASTLERIDAESRVAVGKQMLAMAPQPGVAATLPAASATPRFRNVVQRLPNAMKGAVLTPEGLARTHLGRLDNGRAKRASEDLLQVEDVSALRNGAHIVRFGTKVQGVEVFRRSVRVLIDGEQTLRAIAGVWPPVSDDAVAKATLTWSRCAQDALASALEVYGFEATATRASVRARPAEGGYVDLSPQQAVAGSLGETLHSARARQVLFPLDGRLIPSWYVETVVGPTDAPEADYYAHVVDADTGAILFRHHQTEDANFKWNVWAESAPSFLPFATPHDRGYVPYPGLTSNGTIPPTAPTNVISLQNVPFSANDPWLPGAATVTTGNNAEAYADIGGADGFEVGTDFRSPVFPEAGADPAPYDLTQDPAASLAQREAAVRQMFYMVNWVHDWYYDAGFDEVSGNAQGSNFGRGGLGNDSIRAEGQDNTNSPGINCAPNCANNANMSTPADGGRPRMQMYVFSPTGAASFSMITPSAATFGVGLPGWSAAAFDVTAEVVQAQDQVGSPAGSTATDGCTAYSNAAAVVGKIAFVDRGACDFVVKTQMAIDAGAIGVLIGNVATSNSPGTAPGMACQTNPCPAPGFPSLSLNLDSANAVRTALAGTVTGRMLREAGVRPDGTIDNQIMAHELGHYISNRLVENSSGLSTNMSRGMGEGWGDFHSVLFTVKEEDLLAPFGADFAGAYPLAMYPTGNFFYGLRRYPYSTNFAVNPLTLRHIQTGVPLPTNPPPLFTGDNAAVHSTGEVWASALWQCYAGLLNSGLPFADAQERMKAYLIAGYKLTPPAPLITEARDAILAAVAAQDITDFEVCAAGFAQRGLGIDAATPDRNGTTNAGTVEDFSTDGRVAFGDLVTDDDGTCDDDGILDADEAGTLTIPWNNTGWKTLSDSSVDVSSDFAGLTFGGDATATLSVDPTTPYGTADVVVPVELAGAPAGGVITLTLTPNDPDLEASTPVNVELRVNYDELAESSAADTFDTRMFAWNLRLTDGATDIKEWRVDEVAGQRVARAPGAGAVGVAWIESPDFVVGGDEFSLTLNHRFSFESDGTHYDGGVVDISTDGGANWTPISGTPSIYGGVLSNCCDNPLQGRQALVANSAGYPAFIDTTINLGTTYSGQTVRVRFGVAEDVAVGTAGWDINTVTVTGAVNLPFPSVAPQGQVCGLVAAPVIGVDPASLDATAAVDGTTVATLVIGNTGDATLDWSAAEVCDLPDDIAWLTLTPDAGSTDADGATEIDVGFDATGLDAGDYAAQLCIDSNDPVTPRVTVPVTFTVTAPLPPEIFDDGFED